MRRLWRASGPADFIILGGTIWHFSQIRAFSARVVFEIECMTTVNKMKNLLYTLIYSFLVFTQKVFAEHTKALKVSEEFTTLSECQGPYGNDLNLSQNLSSNFGTLLLSNLYPFLEKYMTCSLFPCFYIFLQLCQMETSTKLLILPFISFIKYQPFSQLTLRQIIVF